ncbi:hypothetical protein [Streptomyces sp. NRRL WC-3742]|uniref:hypothetical protein n=1 Tax=Streptomyces sp. NRRL WC-3742 TaxID=1463934 RepID=UPI001F2655B9|nr:hypothetical protein [Streptomyces sp. NRRL WC-3742]
MAARRLADLRKAAGYTQESLVDAFASMANSLAIDAAVSVRQLRRWESPNPQLAVEQRRPWEAVAAATASVELARVHGGARVRSVVALRLARALSAAGDHAGARSSLTLALTWHDRADKDTDAPRWTAFSGQVEIDYATAAWHVQTGRPAHAIPFLRSALKQLGPTYSRNAALYRARLAEVLLEAGEVEEACAEALASASAAQGMTSARLVDRLGAVASSAERIGTAPARDFVARVRAFGVRVENGRRA